MMSTETFIEILKTAPTWFLLLMATYWFLAQIFPKIRIGRGEETPNGTALIQEYKEVIRHLKDAFSSSSSTEQETIKRILEIFQESNDAIDSLSKNMRELAGEIRRLCRENNDLSLNMKSCMGEITGFLQKIDRGVKDVGDKIDE